MRGARGPKVFVARMESGTVSEAAGLFIASFIEVHSAGLTYQQGSETTQDIERRRVDEIRDPIDLTRLAS